ncbi:hypothetical protein OROHE_009798 [Orobanche hederae]
MQYEKSTGTCCNKQPFRSGRHSNHEASYEVNGRLTDVENTEKILKVILRKEDLNPDVDL